MNAKAPEPEPLQAFYLPPDEVDQATDTAHKLRGLVDCMRVASLSSDDLTSTDSIAGACWLARDLIDELERISTLRQPATGA